LPSPATATARKPTATKPTAITQPRASLFISGKKRSAVLCLLLLLLTLAFYNPIVNNGFTNYDDNGYITDNPHVRAGLTWETVKWAFTSFDAANWHPLTWLSHALDIQLFKLNPAGHHYVNVLLHGANAILLFLLLEGATGLTWPSWMVAALFALHPVNVESVAWAAETCGWRFSTFKIRQVSAISSSTSSTLRLQVRFGERGSKCGAGQGRSLSAVVCASSKVIVMPGAPSVR